MSIKHLASCGLLALLMATGLTAQTERHTAMADKFRKLTGYPKGRPGWVVDHKVALCAGGPDTLANMQWSPADQAKIKDRFEKQLCRYLKAQGLTVKPK